MRLVEVGTWLAEEPAWLHAAGGSGNMVALEVGMVAEFVSVREHQLLNNTYGCRFFNGAATMVVYEMLVFPFYEVTCNHGSLRDARVPIL